MNKLAGAIGAASALCLAACNNTDHNDSWSAPVETPDTQQLCVSMGSSNASVSSAVDPACTDCSVNDAPRAADDDLDSAASVTAGDHPGDCTVLNVNCDPPHGVTLRATAQSGVVFPAGNYPAVYTRGPAGTWSLQLRTFLNGALQEEDSLSSSSASGDHSSASAFQTSKPFDAVEVFLANTDNSGPEMIEVRELCSDAPGLHFN